MRKVGLKRKVQRDTSDENETTTNDLDENGEDDVNGDGAVKTETTSIQKKTKKTTRRKKNASKKKPPVPKFSEIETEEEDEAEYEVEDIIDHKTEKGKKFYLIRWKGYTSDSDTWELASTLSCPEIMKNYEARESNSDRKIGKRKNVNKTKSDDNKKQKLTTTEDNLDEEDKEEEEVEEDNGGGDKVEYEVLRILDVDYQKDGSRSFLIHWKGFSSAANTWEPEANLNCQNLIEAFMEKRDNQLELRKSPKETKRFYTSTGLRHSKRNVPRTAYYDMDVEEN